MKVIIHRGGNEIGGNCIEVQGQNSTILLDVGMPINTGLKQQGDCDKVVYDYLRKDKEYSEVLISHAHSDHYGLLGLLPPSTAVYCSSATKDLLDINQIFAKQEELKFDFQIFETYKPFICGDFEILPFLQDHSAFDSQGFIIKAEGKTLIYTGDFRSHGRKKGVHRRLLSLIGNSTVDLLLTEGTTLSRASKPMKTEEAIEQELVKAMEAKAGLIYVCFSPLNIDRLVSIYKAARITKRTLVVDTYTAYLLEKLSQYAKIPNVKTFSNLKVFYPKKLSRKLKINRHEDILISFKKARIFMEDLQRTPSKYVMMIRPSMIDEIVPLEDTLLIYSMWPGYLKQVDMKKMTEWCKVNAIEFKTIHTSGHVSSEFLVDFIAEINAFSVKIIHTEGINRDSEEMKELSKYLGQNDEVIVI
ncbi:MAG TPA: MBL fold metallo-hydrolase [Desulfosporosinus sp.]|nr:MBL fold metallo-hydrolase [Desulfosporosinus sp.]